MQDDTFPSAVDGQFVYPWFDRGMRLGNLLFQTAAVLAHAKRTGTGFKLFTFGLGPAVMMVEELQLGRYMEVHPFPVAAAEPPVYMEPFFHYGPIPRDFRHGGMVGYFQSDKYFSDCAGIVRKVYSPLVATKREDKTAGVFVRLGDYLEDGRFFIPGKEWIGSALKLLSPDIERLVVFSDSPSKAARIVGSAPGAKRYVIEVDNNSTVPALRRATGMQELVLSASTYSWWAAWLGGQSNVIVPKEWFVNSISDYGDIYVDGWKKL